jgi:hypothetical protein
MIYKEKVKSQETGVLVVGKRENYAKEPGFLKKPGFFWPPLGLNNYSLSHISALRFDRDARLRGGETR